MRRATLMLLALLPAAAQAQNAPIPPAEAAGKMTLPAGFKATLFAGEPDVVQPIAMCTDHRGRLWVVECKSYPKWIKPGAEGHDRVLIFEDKNGRGHFDSCKVFYDKGVNLSGIQVGFGGVWLCSTPNLIFIPDRDGDDVPDGPAEVVLDGWSLNAKHNVFNGLTWGPDGWLWGLNGILATSNVGKPGAADDQRTALNCGVWRFHPTRKVFEPVCWGTTNPWGLDFDDYGQAFITNCVIQHVFHAIPGAHYRRMYGQDLNTNTYGLMETCADHIHWAGGPWTEARGGSKHSDAGGGHAHSGALVYLGDNFPAEYRNSLFTCNIHGNRVNRDTLEHKGSGYVAHHAKDFLMANDPWFRGINLTAGPDGAVYVSDWCDTGECHNYDKVDASNGRIYKVTCGDAPSVNVDLAKLPDEELVKLQLHKNDWYVRHARRLLQERHAAGKLAAGAREALVTMAREQKDPTRQLRAMWALHCTGGLDGALALHLLRTGSDYVRAWAVRLDLEKGEASEGMGFGITTAAMHDPSAAVRLHLASAMQRMPAKLRWSVADALAEHADDAADPMIPLMIWYGVEPLVPADPERAVAFLAKAQIPLVREFLARRIAARTKPQAAGETSIDPLVTVLSKTNDAAVQLDVLKGIDAALSGRREAPLPAGWPEIHRKLAASKDDGVRDRAVTLSVIFGDPQALATLRATLIDSSATPAARTSAMETLVRKKVADLAPALQKLVEEPAVRAAAIRGLGAYGDEATPAVLLKVYGSLTDAEKSDAINTLASRPVYALALLGAIEKEAIPRRDLSAFTARQLAGLGDKKVEEKLNAVWGATRPASQERAALMAKYKTLLTPAFLKKADLSNGRAVFAKQCASCHVLFDAGGKIGPELTGSQRGNLDYVLENVLDPSAVVAKDYQVTIVQTNDGRVINGIIKLENENAVTLQTQNEVVVVPLGEIAARKKSNLSMMPDGLWDKLSKEEVRDLVAYLAAAHQVPLPKGFVAPAAHAAAAPAGAPVPVAAIPEKSEITHSFLVTGGKTYIVGADGKITWTFPKGTRDGWVLENGNILLAVNKDKDFPGGGVMEVTREGKTVFSFKGTQSEVNTVQALPDGKYMLTEAGPKPRLMEIDREGKILLEFPLKCQLPNHHMQTRMSRKLDNGNYLVPHLLDKVVREYNAKGEVVWEVATPHWAFTAIRLANGNTLINCTHGNSVIEVDAAGKTVWQVTNDDLPGKPIKDACGGQRLPNGNTVICSYAAGGGDIRAFEVTPDKKIVWTYRAADPKAPGVHEIHVLDTNGEALKGPAMR